MLRRKFVLAPEGAPAAAPAASTPPAGGPPTVFGAAVTTTPPPVAPATPPPGPTNSYKVEDWRHALPDDIREEPSLKPMNDPAALAKSYIHAQKAIGSDKVPLPGKHATDDDWQKFYDTIGRPPMEKYEVKLPKEAKYVDPKLIEALKPVAHKSGILPSQLEKIVEAYEAETGKTVTAQQAAFKQQLEGQINGLKEKWGQTYDQRVKWAARFVEEQGGPDFVKFFNEQQVGMSPQMVEFFAKLGEAKYKEGSIPGEANAKPVFDPAEANRRANEILADANHPYNKSDHPNHIAAVQEVNNLFAMAHPNVKGT